MSSWTEKDQSMFERIRDRGRRAAGGARRGDVDNAQGGVPRPSESAAAPVDDVLPTREARGDTPRARRSRDAAPPPGP